MLEKFIALLTSFGGKATNKGMLEALGWEKDEYLNLRAAMVADGVIKLAKGRGGSVVLVKKEG
jgi:hypothetical protein